MRLIWFIGALLCWTSVAGAQTAEELVAKNTQAKGGIEKIKAIKTLRLVGKLERGDTIILVSADRKAGDLLRQNATIQGMTRVQAYDGSEGWQIDPFQGRRDPELLGDDDLRDLAESADFYGPLIDYQAKGNKISFIGHDTVDGDDALRLKVTLKNGDIINYFLDPDSYLEIRTEKQMFIGGSVRESVSSLGSYKQVDGVYFPFSIEAGPKRDPSSIVKITFNKIEANVPLADAEFKLPASPATPSPQKHPEPDQQKNAKPAPEPVVTPHRN